MGETDLISRQAAIDALKAHEDYKGYLHGDFEEILETLPSVQTERWIPCSERLPEAGTEVFVYLFDSPSPYTAWIEDTHWYTEDFEVDREDEPIAWMPLPEPYKGEQE